MTIWRPSKRGSVSTLAIGSISALTRCSTCHAELLVRHLAAAEAQRHLDLVAFLEEPADGAHLHVVVVIVDAGPHLDLFDLDDLLVLARLGGLLLLLVFVLAVIEDLGRPADSASGEISTRSSPASVARAMASAVATTPTFWPVSSINRTSRTRMSSFIRGPDGSRSGAARIGRRMLQSPSVVARVQALARPYRRKRASRTRIGEMMPQVKVVAGLLP